MRDISDAVAAEQHLRYSALHDDLTGLPNRALLMDRLDGALARTERTHRETAVLFCDLDGFKRVNDTGGHTAGDRVLAEISRRFTPVVRDGDTVARIGGDEFVVIIEPWNRIAGDTTPLGPEHDRAAATDIADRIRESVRQPVTVDGVEHNVSVSIGIAFGLRGHPGPVGVLNAEQLLRGADDAMYLAKRRGRDRFEVFQSSMRTYGAERTRVETALRQALRTAQDDTGAASVHLLSAAYQPIFSACHPRPGPGFEALARLTDTHGMTISPRTCSSRSPKTSGVI